jgi:hypothetical protein
MHFVRGFFQKSTNINKQQKIAPKQFEQTKHVAGIMTEDEESIVTCARKNGVRKALYYHSSFYKKDPTRAKKLKILMRDYQNNLPHGRTLDHFVEKTVKEHLYKNSNKIKGRQVQEILEAALIRDDQQHLLWKNGGTHLFGNAWFGRAKRRWKVHPNKMIIDPRVEITQSQWTEHMADLSSILRRRPRDPLPCRLQRNTTPKKRYEDEDEEDCWDAILPGGRADTEKLTLLDRLLFPASIRGKFSFYCQKPS